MKNVLMMIAVLLLLSAGPGNVSAAGDAKGAASVEASQQKKQYEKGMEERLKKLGRDLDELNARAATMTEQAKIDINRGIAEARTKQKAASTKLEEMRKRSEKKWKKFIAETDAAMDEFEKAYERAKAHFK
jgi:uncharacterized protein YpuA (DUF1002 family)